MVDKPEKIATGAAKNLFRFQIAFISIILLIAIIGTLVSQSIPTKGKIIVLSILIPLIILGYFLIKWVHKLIFVNFKNWIYNRNK